MTSLAAALSKYDSAADGEKLAQAVREHLQSTAKAPLDGIPEVQTTPFMTLSEARATGLGPTKRTSRASRESRKSRESVGSAISFHDINTEMEVPTYDRRSISVVQGQGSPRKLKVQMLMTLSWISVAAFFGLAHAGVAAPVLALVKILPTCLMLLMVVTLGDGNAYGKRIAVGLLAGAVGDACLELEASPSLAGAPLFLMGLSSGLLGHGAYAYAFLSQAPVTLLTAAPPIAAASVVLGVLWPNLPTDLAAPVLLYICAICTMIALALSRQPKGFAPIWSWRFGSAGAIFYAVSRTVLAYDRFVGKVPLGHQLITASYFLGQFSIAMSARGSRPRPLSKALGSVENFMTGQSFRSD